MHIKNKILVTFLSVAIISVLSLAMLSFFSVRGSLLRTSANQLATLADLKSNIIQTFFNGLRYDISIAQDYYNIKTNLPIVSRFSKDRTNPDYIKAKDMLDGQLLKWLKIKEYVNDIMLVSPEGKVVYSANKGHIKRELDKALPDPQGIAFEEGKKAIFISNIFRSLDDSYGYKFGLFVTAPVFDFQNQFIGVIVFEINMDPIYKLIQDTTGLGKTGETLVVRKEGDHVLYLNPLRYDPGAVLKRKVKVGDKISIPAQEAANGKIGSGISVDYRGKKVLAAWRYLSTLGWGIIAKIDLQEVLAPVIILRNKIALFCLVIIILIMIGSLAVAQSISRPIYMLHKGTEIIGSGNLDYKVGIDAKDEIGQLSRAFDQMTEDLKKITTSRDELNKEISQRKQSEEKIRRLSNIVEYSEDAIISKALDGTILSWNKAAEKMYGYLREDAEGRNISIIVPPEKADELLHIFEKIKHGEIIKHFETKRRKKDGSCIDVSLTISPIKEDEMGNAVAFSSISRDITERKQAQERIAWLASFPEQDPLPICEVDLKGNLLYLNPAAKHLLPDLEAFGSRHPWLAINEGAFESLCKGEKQVVLREVKIDHGVYEQHIFCVLLLQHLRIYAFDVSIRKRMAEMLQESVKAKSAFTSMVSHELRTPLTALKESVSQVAEGMLGAINENQRKILGIAKNNVDRLARLISEVLDFQTLETGKMVFKMQDNSVNAVVKETKETLNIIAKEKGLDFILNLDEELPEIKFDRDKIIQVLMNLVSNSIKLTEKGNITIFTMRGNNVIQVSVKDTGPGIKEEDMPRLFQQYEQLERKTGGTGLGLAISSEIIKAHGGKIWAESTFGQGTTMHFLLPIEERREHDK